MSFDPKIDNFSLRIAAAVASSFDPGKIQQLNVPGHRQKEIIFPQLEAITAQAEEIFKNPETAIDSEKFFDFVQAGFSKIVSDLIQESDSLPPNLVSECGVSEAAFSNGLDPKPIVATDALATCIGIAGYERDSKFGFVIHVAHPAEIENSGAELLKEILSKKPAQPIEIHLRGGVKGQSEPLVATIKKWIEQCSNQGCRMKIMTEDVCSQGFFDADGRISSKSLSLDTRDGAVSEYDAEKNPFSKHHEIREAAVKRSTQDVFGEVLLESSLSKNEIKIVYK